MITETAFVIISAESAQWGDLNEQRTDLLRRQLEGQGHSPVAVEGCYKGTKERAWLVFLDDDPQGAKFDHLVKLARRYGQESILHVDGNRLARLVYVGNDSDRRTWEEDIGKWTQVAYEYARVCDAYSVILGRAYVTSGKARA